MKKSSFEIKCSLGHKQKNRSGFWINPDDSARICDVCGVVFSPMITNKELHKKWKGENR